MSNHAKPETREKVEKAIATFRRSKTKPSISLIAKRAGIERKTIYNNPEILELCKQAIEIFAEVKRAEKEVLAAVEAASIPSSKTLLQQRYEKVKEQLREEREVKAKLLYNNNLLVLQINDLTARIESLESYIAMQKNEKITPIR